MNLPRLKHESLLKEKNLWQIYRASWTIPDSKFNWIAGLSSMALFGFYAITAQNVVGMHGLLMKLAEIGFSSAVSLLGFLIAGFTIFGSLTNPKLLLTMLRFQEKRSRLSYLKYNFFTLIRTFIYFLVFAAFQLIVIIVGQRDGLVSEIAIWLPSFQPLLRPLLRFTFLVSTVLWTVSFLQLKSFVFNVHHFVFTMIKFDAVEHNDQLQADKSDDQVEEDSQ